MKKDRLVVVCRCTRVIGALWCFFFFLIQMRQTSPLSLRKHKYTYLYFESLYDTNSACMCIIIFCCSSSSVFLCVCVCCWDCGLSGRVGPGRFSRPAGSRGRRHRHTRGLARGREAAGVFACCVLVVIDCFGHKVSALEKNKVGLCVVRCGLGFGWSWFV